MKMVDSLLGELEVEIEVGFPTIVLSHVIAGYNLTTWQELNDAELEYLNDKYKQDIIEQAIWLKAAGPTPKENLQ